jgi:protein subunit release factor B
MPADDPLESRLRRLRIHPADLEESFVRGTGAGGQKINKTSSTVRLVHRPTGIEVRCQEERSQSQNRRRALERLCDILESRRAADALAARQAREKSRRQNRPKPRRVKLRMIESKRRRARTKSGRRPPTDE